MSTNDHGKDFVRVAYGTVQGAGYDVDEMSREEVISKFFELTEQDKLKNEERQNHGGKKLTKLKRNAIITLPKNEYAKFCSAIRTWNADKIPQTGFVFLDECCYKFKYDSKKELLVCTEKIGIVGNEDLIRRSQEENDEKIR